MGGPGGGKYVMGRQMESSKNFSWGLVEENSGFLWENMFWRKTTLPSLRGMKKEVKSLPFKLLLKPEIGDRVRLLGGDCCGKLG